MALQLVALRRWRTVIALVSVAMWVSQALAFTLISVDDEIAIGRQADADVRRKVPRVVDAEIVDYLATIGRRLAAVAPGPRYPYGFSVANYRDLNAFALPGGPVWIHRGALEASKSEAEVVGILAHEVAHIAQRHAADELTKAMIASGLLSLLGALLGNDGGAGAARIGASLMADGLFLTFSRENEIDADRLGVALVSRAGWDPRGLLQFMQTLQRTRQRDPGAVEVFFSTHPSPADRIARLQGEIRGLSIGHRETGRFESVKRRLQRLPKALPAPR